MFEKVLFATDFSEHAQKNFECVGEIPGIKEVVLLHVVDATHPSRLGWTYGPQIENAKIRLEDQRGRLGGLGLRARAKVEVITEGDVARAILKAAEEEGVSLIVMGARGMGLVQGIFLGSVSHDVLRHAKTHVLVMPYKLAERLDGKQLQKFCTEIFSKVLCPTDFSGPAEATLSFMKDLEGVEEIVLMHVVDKGETEEELETNVKEAKERLEDIGKELRRAGLRVKVHVRIGNPPVEIVYVAKEENVSLIAMGRRGRGWFRELLLGSTTYAIAKNIRRPLILIHPG